MALNLALGYSESSYPGTPAEYQAYLYDVFMNTLVSNGPPWNPNNTHLTCRRNPEYNGQHGGFWHVVSGGGVADADRGLDSERCLRIHWIRMLIDHANPIFLAQGIGDFKWWVSPRRVSGGQRYVIATSDFSYAVVIDERSTYAVLVTAYYVRQQNRRDRMENEWVAHWA